MVAVRPLRDMGKNCIQTIFPKVASLIDIDGVGLVCDARYDRYYHRGLHDWEHWMSERWQDQGWQHWGPGWAVTAGKGCKPTGKGNGGEGKGVNSYDAMNGKDTGGGYVPTGKGNGGEGKGDNGYEARQGEDDGHQRYLRTEQQRMAIPLQQTPPFDMPPNHYDPATAEALAAEGWLLGPNGWHWPGLEAETADWDRWKRRH